jgi:hypothetical protein
VGEGSNRARECRRCYARGVGRGLTDGDESRRPAESGKEAAAVDGG